jgi:hypothetical protein
MNFILADRIAPAPWRNGGGQTRELWVSPHVANWRVRLSLADIAQDGPFSAFPGVERHFAVVEGAGVVLTLEGREHSVIAGADPIAFDGAWAPACRLIDGPTRDLNLMLQGGASGTMSLVNPESPWQSPLPWRACFVTDPAVLLLPNAEALPLPARCLVTDLPGGPLRLMPSGSGPSFWIGVSGV